MPLPAEQQVEFAVYFSPGKTGVPSTADLLAAARSWVAAHTKEPLRAAIERYLKEGGVVVEVLERDELPLPFDGVFESLPDPDEAKQRFAKAKHAVRVLSRGPPSPSNASLWAAVSAARGIARTTGGLAYDPLTFHFGRDESLTEDLPADGGLAVIDHLIVPYSSADDGRAWVTTLGLAKFGLPNLECRDVPPDIAEEIGSVLNGVAQHLVTRVIQRPAGARELVLDDELTLEEAVFRVANGLGRAERAAKGNVVVRLTFTPERPDGTEAFLTLVPPRSWTGERGVWLHQLVTTLEPQADPVITRPASDAALARARDEARSHLPRVKRRFLAGLAPGETLFVKHAFAGAGGAVEHMWVAVTAWKGAKVEGTLANDPQDIPSLKAGQTVKIDEARVDDWILSAADGTREGGFSVKVLRPAAKDE